MVAEHQVDVPADYPIAELLDVLRVAHRPVAEVEQDVVLHHRSVYAGNQRLVHLSYGLKVPSAILLVAPLGQRPNHVCVTVVRVRRIVHLLLIALPYFQSPHLLTNFLNVKLILPPHGLSFFGILCKLSFWKPAGMINTFQGATVVIKKTLNSDDLRVMVLNTEGIDLFVYNVLHKEIATNSILQPIDSKRKQYLQQYFHLDPDVEMIY